MSGLTEVDALSSWVVCDILGDAIALRELGGQEFPGVSLRRTLDRRGVRLLYASMREAVAAEADRFVNETYAGRKYAVDVRLVWSPDRTTILGATGIYYPVGTVAEDAPVIGTWQWRVDRRTGQNRGPNASRWNDDLYRIYGVDPAGIDTTRGPSAEWLAKFLPPSSAATIKLAIDSGIKDAPQTLQVLGYDAIRQDTGDTFAMCMYARAYPDPDDPGALWLRGFSHSVEKSPKIQPVDRAAPALDGLASAAFALATTQALAAIDVIQGTIFMRSPNWERTGLPADAILLADLAVGSVLDELLDMFRTTARSEVPSSPHDYTLNGTMYRVRVVSADVHLERGRYIVVAFERVS
ncbi:hypothetical protein [Rathayibacter tritici]|uniref:hypothetical protein n=1 Tax=Rathayibacter tritici TaxID=33888 RepID=UPI0011B0523F|nr:hypothetical protein [Rathayibacter tritici]